MRNDFWMKSQGGGKLHYCRWDPAGEPKAVMQIVHGIAEHVERYDDFANFLTDHGFVVIAEDHMGHGGSVQSGDPLGYFAGGWFTAVEDTYTLLTQTQAEFPGLPYILFGHSMGSFMTRTILCKHPDSGISAAIICGTGWQPTFALPVMEKAAELLCKKDGEKNPSPTMEKLAFGSYNKKVEHPRTTYDWLTRDNKIVDAYMADPKCGFTATAGLYRDLLQGIAYNQKPDSLGSMKKDLPVFFISGGEDPVGDYGKGVRKAVEAFRKAGMTDVKEKLYPLCRHEILNEINKQEVYDDVLSWITGKVL